MTQIKINYQMEIILSLLNGEGHGRALAKQLKTSLTRIQSILTELRKNNVVDYKEVGRNHLYFIKKNLVAKSFVLNAEEYKLVKIISKYNFLEALFLDVIEKSKAKLIILFGSYAKELAHKNSDVDIYIDTMDKNIKEKVQLLNDLLSVKIGNFDSNDLLIKEIITNHIIIQGAEKFYENLRFFK